MAQRITKILENDRFFTEDTPLTRRGSKKYENVLAVDKIHTWLNFTNTKTDERTVAKIITVVMNKTYQFRQVQIII